MKKFFLILVIALIALPMFALPLGMHIGVITETSLADPFESELKPEKMPLGAEFGIRVTLACAEVTVFKQNQFLFGNIFAGLNLKVNSLMIKTEVGLPYIYEIGEEFIFGTLKDNLLAKVGMGIDFRGFYFEGYVYGSAPGIIEAIKNQTVALENFRAGIVLGAAF